MEDKNLDSDGYLTYDENSSTLRQAVAKTLLEVDLHSNMNMQYFSDDLIYGKSGLHRQDYMRLTADYYTYTQLAVFLFVKGFLKVLIESEEQDGAIKGSIILPEFDRLSFDRKVSNITGSRFEKEIKKSLWGQNLLVVPLHSLEPYIRKPLIFSLELQPNDLISVPYNGGKIYYLEGNDILFPEYHNPK